MEARMRKYNEVSPERAKVWREKSPKYHQKIKKVPIVYYLSKNRQLEHPHFMEVLISSPNGLYLRDVIERLNVLRGRGMASMYSWSSKRSYRNGFVWHDLSEDDLILPAHGNEYVLKGSELFEESNSDHFSPIENSVSQNMKQIVVEPPSCTSMDDSSSSSSMNNEKETANKHSQENDELSPQALRSVSSSGVSPDSRDAKNSSSWCLAEYKVYKSEGLADASTQTDETISGCSKNPVETFSRGVSTDEDESPEPQDNEINLVSEEASSSYVGKERESAEISRNSVSPPSSNSAKTDTLESLIRADVSKMNSFRILEQEDVRLPASSRLRASNMLMQLISCGSISVKDNNFGLVPSYKPKFGHSKFPSPFLSSSSFMLRDLDRLSETPSLMGMKLEEKEYFSGSLVETKLQKKVAGDGNASLKRSSSYNGDRASNQMSVAENSKPSCSRDSSKDTTKNVPCSTKSTDMCSKRITESLRKPDSFREDDEKVIKIDERLASGARVVIQSNVA